MMRRTPMKPGKGFKQRGDAAMRDSVNRPNALLARLQDRDPDRVRPTPAVSSQFRQAERIEGHTAPIEKENASQHGPYMALVRMFPCARCSRPPPSQFCHADMGKGTGIKTDVRRGFPGCPECHVLLGSSGKIPRAERRELEALYGRQTRDKMRAMNLWPRTLADWKEDEDARL